MTDPRDTERAEKITQDWLDAKELSGAAYRKLLVDSIATEFAAVRREALEGAIIAAIQAPEAPRGNMNPWELHGRDVRTVEITAAIRRLIDGAGEKEK